jgi:hypothetical protein
MNKLIGMAALLLGCGGVWAGVQEDNFINLANSGAEEKVLTAYIDVAGGSFHFTVDQIIELKDLGVSSKVISDALKHGGPAETATAAVPVDKSPSIPEANEPSATAAVLKDRSPSAPVVHDTLAIVSTPAPPVYVYPYPWCYYGYWPYAYWGGVWISNYPWGRGPFYYGRWPGRGTVAGYRAGYNRARGWGRAGGRGGRR